MAMITCQECGKEISSRAGKCPYCGCPIDTDYNYDEIELRKNLEKDIKKRNIIIAILLAVALIVGAFIFTKVREENYKSVAYECFVNMGNGASQAEDVNNTIQSVWNNCIWQVDDSTTNKYTKDSNGQYYSDFNDALSELFSDEAFVEQVTEINENYDEVNSELKELANPPKSCQDMHDALMDLYDEYYRMVQCATNPTGSLATYSEEFSDADSSCAEKLNKAAIYFQ